MSLGLGLGLGLTGQRGGGASSYTGPQIVLIGYGQSGWGNHMGTTDNPDAAAEGTFYWDPAANVWTTSVPAGNGIRKILNGIAAVTGKTVGVVSYSKSGVGIAALLEGAGTGDPATGGTDYYGALSLQLSASKCRKAEELYILIDHGEGDGNANSVDVPLYQSRLDTLHQSIVDDVARTKPQCPMILCGIGRITSPDYIATDATWDAIQGALITAHDFYPNIHYSHPDMDAELTSDLDNHWTAASLGRSGQRYARKLLSMRGDVPTQPAWFITGIEKVDATTTRVTVAHSMGTDFTPDSDITGFEVSDDGETWIDATGARVDVTTIDLTHTALGAADSNDRFVHYQYGKDPDISGAVFDNGSLTMPLTLSAGRLLVDYAFPVMTSVSSAIIDEGAEFVATLTASRPSTYALGGADAALFAVVDDELHFIDAAEAGDYDVTVTPTAIDNGDVGDAQSVSISVIAAYTEVGVTFDGTNDYLKTAALIGAADAKTALIFVSADFPAIDGNRYILLNFNNNVGSVQREGTTGIIVGSWGNVTPTASVIALNSSMHTTVGQAISNERGNILIALNADGTSWLYFWRTGSGIWEERASDTSGGGVNLDFTGGWAIGARESIWNGKFPGKMYRVAMWQDITLPDLSDPLVRAAFADASTGVTINPANSIALCGTPIIDFYGDAATWNAGTNHGSGGNFTMVGALT